MAGVPTTRSAAGHHRVDASADAAEASASGAARTPADPPSSAAAPSPSCPRSGGDVYGVLADPTRRRLLTALRGQERSVGDLVIELAVSQPTVSKHLRTLREGGLVRMRASGQRRLYSLRLEPLQEAARWLGDFSTAAAANAVTDPATDGTLARSAEAGAVARAVEGTVLDGPDGARIAGEDGSSPIGRTVGRAAGRAAEMIASIPRLRRRNGKY